MKVLVALALLAVTAYAALPCQSPDAMSYRAHRWEWDFKYFERYFSQYDKKNQRVVMFAEEFGNSTRRYKELLFLHVPGVGYDLDLRTRKCSQFKIGPFWPMGVHENATYEGEFVVGGPFESLDVDRWSDKQPNRRAYYVGEFTLQHCYPFQHFRIENEDFNKTSLTFYEDVQPFIVIPNDFDVPRECNSDSVEILDEMPEHARKAQSVYNLWSYDDEE